MKGTLKGYIVAYDVAHGKWRNAIYVYTETGDIRPLAKLVRNEKIPDQFRSTIADILDGTKSHKKLSSESARSFQMRKEYSGAITKLRIKRTFEFAARQLTYKLLLKYPIVMVNTQYPNKLIIQHIAKEFYKNNYESARRVIHRKVNQHGWPKLPD